MQKVTVALTTWFVVSMMATVFAGDKDKHGGTSFEGKISAIDFKANTIEVSKKEGKMSFVCAPDCKFFVEHIKQGAKLSDFKVGDKIEVSYAVENSQPVAHRVAEKGSHADKKEHQEEKKN